MELVEHKQRMDICDAMQSELSNRIYEAKKVLVEAEALYAEEKARVVSSLRDDKVPTTIIETIARGKCADYQRRVGLAKAILDRCENEYNDNKTSITISQNQVKYFTL